MVYRKLKDLLSFVIYGDNSWRATIDYKEKNAFSITLDLHELDRNQAALLINNTIAIIRCPYTLEIIHGYNHGLVLKQMITNTLAKTNKRIGTLKSVPYNPGISILSITY